MARLRGTEEWSDEDISATVTFFLGCAENATALRQELGPGREAVSIDPQQTSPLEPFTKAVALLLATDRLQDAIDLLHKPARLVDVIPYATGNHSLRYEVSVAEFTRVAIFSALIERARISVEAEALEIAVDSGDFTLVRTREDRNELLAVLPVLSMCAVALRSELDTLNALTSLISFQEDSPGAFVIRENLEFRALGIFGLTEKDPLNWRLPNLNPIDAAFAIQQMESRYDRQLQSYRQDRYHWNLMNTEGDLIAWPLLMTEVAAFRAGIIQHFSFQCLKRTVARSSALLRSSSIDRGRVCKVAHFKFRVRILSKCPSAQSEPSKI